MLRDSVVVVVVVRTRPRAIPLAMITIRKSFMGFHDYGAPLGGPSGRRIIPCSTNLTNMVNVRVNFWGVFTSISV